MSALCGLRLPPGAPFCGSGAASSRGRWATLPVNYRLSFPVPARSSRTRPVGPSPRGRSFPGLRPRVASPRRPPVPPPMGPGGRCRCRRCAGPGPARRAAERSGPVMAQPGEEDMDSNVLAIVVAASEWRGRGSAPGTFLRGPPRRRDGAGSVRFRSAPRTRSVENRRAGGSAGPWPRPVAARGYGAVLS